MHTGTGMSMCVCVCESMVLPVHTLITRASVDNIDLLPQLRPRFQDLTFVSIKCNEFEEAGMSMIFQSPFGGSRVWEALKANRRLLCTPVTCTCNLACPCEKLSR